MLYQAKQLALEAGFLERQNGNIVRSDRWKGGGRLPKGIRVVRGIDPIDGRPIHFKLGVWPKDERKPIVIPFSDRELEGAGL